MHLGISENFIINIYGPRVLRFWFFCTWILKIVSIYLWLHYSLCLTLLTVSVSCGTLSFVCVYTLLFRCWRHEWWRGFLQHQWPWRGFLFWGVQQQPAQWHQGWRQCRATRRQPKQQQQQHQESHLCPAVSGQGEGKRKGEGEGTGEGEGGGKAGRNVRGASSCSEEASPEAAVTSSQHQLRRHPSEPHKEAPELPSGAHVGADWQHLLQQVFWLHEFQPEWRRGWARRGSRRLQ